MRAVVLSHVNQFAGFLHSLKSGLNHRCGVTDKSDHSAVGSLSRIHVQQFHAISAADDVGDLFDDVHVAALAEVGHAFHDLSFVTHVLVVMFMVLVFCAAKLLLLIKN